VCQVVENAAAVWCGEVGRWVNVCTEESMLGINLTYRRSLG
jgi:hypothetical protein